MDYRTIFALSTVYGKSGVAVIRISGKDAIKAVEQLSDINIDNIRPRYAYFTKIYEIGKIDTIDNAILL